MSNIQTIDDANNDPHKIMISINGSEFELASPWRRIAAYLINYAIYYLIYFIGFLIYNSLIDHEINSTQNIVRPLQIFTTFIKGYENQSYIFYCIILPIILFAIWQVIQMSLKGQSIGKFMMKIKVINVNGQNCGFEHIVLIREISVDLIKFSLFLSGVNILKKWRALHLLDFLDTTQYHILFTIYDYLIPSIFAFICFIMLFPKKTHHRTLQDYLAGTIVIKV